MNKAKNKRIIRSWSSKSAVKHYLGHRGKLSELYRSERYFMQEALKKEKSMLDIGCAAGGFLKIARRYNKNIDYTGVDISPTMIDEARGRSPNGKFCLTNGETLDFPDNFFDVCLSFGVFHMVENWKRLLAEAWRVCRNTLLFDLRIVKKKDARDKDASYQRLEFNEKWDGISRAPYVVLGVDEAVRHIVSLKPRIKSFKSYGYWHPVSKSTVSRYSMVCMSVFCLRKKAPKESFEWRLPFEVPFRLKAVLPG